MKPIDQYHECGYVVLKDFFSDIEIFSVDQHVDRIYRKWMIENETEIFNNKLVNMHSLTGLDHFEGLREERIFF